MHVVNRIDYTNKNVKYSQFISFIVAHTINLKIWGSNILGRFSPYDKSRN